VPGTRFHNRCIVEERASGGQPLAQRGVQCLDSIIDIEQPLEGGRVVQKPRQALPARKPTRADGRVRGITALGKARQRLLGFRPADCGIAGRPAHRHCTWKGPDQTQFSQKKRAQTSSVG